MHIARIDYGEFFAPAFESLAVSRAFVECVEGIPRTEGLSKIVLHQAARMIWLADRIDEVARGRPALQILFYLIAAEAVAKMVCGSEQEGQSRKHVRLFFEEICSDEHRRILADAFADRPLGQGVGVRRTVDYLYDVRCDVVHEGDYISLTLRSESDPTDMLTVDGPGFLIAQTTASELRQIVLEGAVLAAKRLLPVGSPCLNAPEPPAA